MGFFIDEFRAEPHRTTVPSGGQLQVILRGHWEPVIAGGTEVVQLSVQPGSCQVFPNSFNVVVDPLVVSSTFVFPIQLTGPSQTFARVVATSSHNFDPLIVEVT